MDQPAIDAAFNWAVDSNKKIVVLQLLDSHLYSYGKNDYIVPSYARTQFLMHIQTNMEEDGAEREKQLLRRAEQMNIAMVIKTVETDDAAGFVTQEAGKGYDRIFVPREKRALFPVLREPTLAKALRKKGLGPVAVS